MGEDLPTKFDLIVVGTGFTESVIAAAASRIGKKVLHLDPNDFYGSYWASFNLRNIETLADQPEETPTINTIANKSLSLGSNAFRLKNISQKWWISDDAIGKWSKTKIQSEFRRFNIDITPKLILSRGSLVELLITSNICRYAEFRAVDHVITFIDGQFKSVPCSRSDVFTTKNVNVVEKRLLMKFLSGCLKFNENNDEYQVYKNTTFLNYLKERKLTPNIIHYVMNAISMSDEETPYYEGVLNTKKFLLSLGRYGNTPYLFSMYGCGEIPQCFCRLCAVFGGVYCLKKSVKSINFSIDQNKFQKFESITCESQNITATNIILGHGSICGVKFNQERIESPKCGNLSRGIYITDTPIGGDDINKGGGGVNFLKSELTTKGAFIIQLSHYSGTCPKDLYIIHITCKGSDNVNEDLKPYSDQLFKDFEWSDNEGNEVKVNGENAPRPKVLWTMFFTIPTCTKCDHASETPIEGVHLTCGPQFELDYDKSIAEAKNLFKKIFENEEFLPRAPDPEDIIIGDGDECNYPENEL